MTFKAGVLKPNQITDHRDVVSKPAEDPPETSQAGRNPDQRDGHQREEGIRKKSLNQTRRGALSAIWLQSSPHGEDQIRQVYHGIGEKCILVRIGENGGESPNKQLERFL